MKEPSRVLCVFARLDRGGAETMCMNIYRHIDRNKIQFDFIKHTHDKGAYEGEILSLGGKIYEAPRLKGYNLFTYRAWWKNHLTKHTEHRIIHGHFFTISAVYFKIAKQLNRYTVGHSHSSKPAGSSAKAMIKKLLYAHIEDYADACVACSQKAGEWLFPHREFTVLNNAVDSQKLKYDPVNREAVRNAFNIENNFVVGIVGSLSHVKNPFGTIEIFKAFYKHNSNARLLWVGDGPLRQEIEAKLAEEHLSDAVIMTGVRSDVDQLMQAMDVFILPSLWEGLPVVLMEAQAAGLPCFISDTVTCEAAITELCTFLSNDKPEQWAEQILQADIDKRRDTSREIIEAGYDIRTTAKWLEEFYLNCSN